MRGQGVKNKLPTLELKLLSSVNGLFLTGACIVKEPKYFITWNLFLFRCRLFLVKQRAGDMKLQFDSRDFHSNYKHKLSEFDVLKSTFLLYITVPYPNVFLLCQNNLSIQKVRTKTSWMLSPTKSDCDPRDAVGTKSTSAQLFSTCYLYSPSHHITTTFFVFLVLLEMNLNNLYRILQFIWNKTVII